MGKMRIEKTKNYTIMSKYHLRDRSLSLKAKGLLSVILALPDNWDYTIAGLAAISREGIDTIRRTINELEDAGYICRVPVRDERGRYIDTDYTVYEQPRDHR